MLKYYSEQIKNPIILEIGVFQGEFLEYIFTKCRTAKIDAVDLFEGIVWIAMWFYWLCNTALSL